MMSLLSNHKTKHHKKKPINKSLIKIFNFIIQLIFANHDRYVRLCDGSKSI